MTMPRYITNSAIAAHLGVHHVTVIGWRKKYPPTHQQVPTPAPAAVIVEKHGELSLWAEDQLPEWETWHHTFQEYNAVLSRVRMAHARAAQGGAS